MLAGAVHDTIGVAFNTVSGTVAMVGAYDGSAGVNVTDKVRAPAPGTVPNAGEYTNTPGTPAVAFSWMPLRTVGYVIAAGAGHDTGTVGFVTFNNVVAVAGA